MELWIRSQDKKKLLKSTSFGLDNDETSIFANNYDGDYVNAGKYKTKERALEVLDEIQKLLNPMVIFNNCKYTQDVIESIKETGACFVTDNARVEQINTCIYEMPKE